MTKDRFKKTYSNTIIGGPSKCGVVYKKASNISICKLNKIKRFISDYQEAYKNEQIILDIPKEISREIKAIRFKFRLEKDSIGNMITYIKNRYRIKDPILDQQYKRKKPIK